MPKPKVHSRVGNEASQAMLIAGDDNLSRISTCLATAHHFLLSPEEAKEIVQRQVAAIAEHWDAVCEEAAISTTDRSPLASRQFLNPFSMEGLSMDEVRLS